MTPKRILVAGLKIGISLAILGYLFSKAVNDASFAELWAGQKRWDLLLGAAVAALLSVAITFVRWYLLLRAVKVPATLNEAFRIGFVGYLFNFVSIGMIGGDLLKAWLVARHHPGRRAAAVASVAVDRVIGVYALLVVATVAFWLMDWDSVAVRDPAKLAAVKKMGQVSTWLSVGGAIGFVVIMVPAAMRGGLWPILFRLPRVGKVIEQLVEAVKLYQKKWGLVIVSLVMSFGVHALSTVSIYLAACGLPGNEPSFGTHFVIVPICMLTAAVPLPGGIGAFEFALDFLYRAVTSDAVGERQGFIVALAYRAITMLIAAIGLGYYMASRQEVASVMREGKHHDEGEAAVDSAVSQVST